MIQIALILMGIAVIGASIKGLKEAKQGPSKGSEATNIVGIFIGIGLIIFALVSPYSPLSAPTC